MCARGQAPKKISHANYPQVLADSFETRFNPFTLETPRVRANPARMRQLAMIPIYRATADCSAVPSSISQYTSHRIHLGVSVYVGSG